MSGLLGTGILLAAGRGAAVGLLSGRLLGGCPGGATLARLGALTTFGRRRHGCVGSFGSRRGGFGRTGLGRCSAVTAGIGFGAVAAVAATATATLAFLGSRGFLVVCGGRRGGFLTAGLLTRGAGRRCFLGRRGFGGGFVRRHGSVTVAGGLGRAAATTFARCRRRGFVSGLGRRGIQAFGLNALGIVGLTATTAPFRTLTLLAFRRGGLDALFGGFVTHVALGTLAPVAALAAFTAGWAFAALLAGGLGAFGSLVALGAFVALGRFLALGALVAAIAIGAFAVLARVAGVTTFAGFTRLTGVAGLVALATVAPFATGTLAVVGGFGTFGPLSTFRALAAAIALVAPTVAAFAVAALAATVAAFTPTRAVAGVAGGAIATIVGRTLRCFGGLGTVGGAPAEQVQDAIKQATVRMRRALQPDGRAAVPAAGRG